MTLLMAGSIMVVMMSFMLGMYRNRRWNVAIIAGGVALMVLGTFLVRTQITVQDRSYMSGMIPHHSIAILTSENSEIEDVRVCELAVGIIDAQRREISEMEWLIDDIRANGPARSAAEADQRPVPDFEAAMAARSLSVVTNANRLRRFRAREPRRDVGPQAAVVRVEIAEQHELSEEEDMAAVHDPVCGMDIDPANAVGSEEHEGETYYFCSKACQEAFKTDPSKYVA